MQPLVIRADATPDMGSGHIMRCRALATSARALGAHVRMGGRCTVPWLVPLLKEEGFIFFNDPLPEKENPPTLISQLHHMGASGGPECAVVLDGYRFGPDCHNAVRMQGYRLMVVDDYAHLPRYDCDILLNQNPHAGTLSYEGSQSTRLLGLDYALLRPEFVAPAQRNEASRDILVSLGGGNFLQFLELLAPTLALPALRGRTLKIIAGSMERNAVIHVLRHCEAQVKILPRVHNMATLLATTSMCISAGGSTCWELCRMGVPFLTVEVAENQRGIIEWLDKSGIAPRFSSTNLDLLLKNEALRRTASSKGRALVDGQGTMRVANMLLS